MKTGIQRPSDSNVSVLVDIGDPYPGREEILQYWGYINPAFEVPALKSWGGDNYGQLGTNSISNVSTPVSVGALTNWREVSAGGLHVAAVKTNGTAWCWGDNDYGQLGNNDTSYLNRSSPVQVGALTNWQQVSAGWTHTVAVKTDGTMWAWGSNWYGQLGVTLPTKTLVNNYTPGNYSITLPRDWSLVNTVQVQGGGGGGSWGGRISPTGLSTSYRYPGDGGGGGGYAQQNNITLTLQSSINYTVGAGGAGGYTPASTTNSTDTNAKGLAGTPSYFSSVVGNGGGGSYRTNALPVPVAGTGGGTSGGGTGSITGNNGNVWVNNTGGDGGRAWAGSFTVGAGGVDTAAGSSGQNGGGGGGGGGGVIASLTISYSTGVGGGYGAGGNGAVGGDTVVSINGSTVIAYGGKGGVWGVNPSGRNPPPPVWPGGAGGSYLNPIGTGIAGGSGCTTYNTYSDPSGGGGAIGAQSPTTATAGAQSADFEGLQSAVTYLGLSWTAPGSGITGSDGNPATGFGCGGAGGAYVFSSTWPGSRGGDGLWGGGGAGGTYMSYGGINRGGGGIGGNGVIVLRYVLATGSTIHTTLTGAGSYTFPAGTVEFNVWAVGGGGGGAWASGGFGLSGSGGGAGGVAYVAVYSGNGGNGGAGGNGFVQVSYTQSLTVSPVQVGSATNWQQVSAGGYHTLALDNTGSLWAWGLNSSGQLGDTTTVQKSSPVPIPGPESFYVAISAGAFHSLAISTTGKLYAWGLNSSGQVGASTGPVYAYATSPILVGSATNWRSISAHGSYSSAATNTNSQVYTWGSNNNGQLGLGDTVNRSSPVQIGTKNIWSSIAMGLLNSAAITTDGSLWAWGYNTNGELGNGNTVNKSSPAHVGSLTNWKSVSVGGNQTGILTTVGGASITAQGFSISIVSATDF